MLLRRHVDVPNFLRLDNGGVGWEGEGGSFICMCASERASVASEGWKSPSSRLRSTSATKEAQPRKVETRAAHIHQDDERAAGEHKLRRYIRGNKIKHEPWCSKPSSSFPGPMRRGRRKHKKNKKKKARANEAVQCEWKKSSLGWFGRPERKRNKSRRYERRRWRNIKLLPTHARSTRITGFPALREIRLVCAGKGRLSRKLGRYLVKCELGQKLQKLVCEVDGVRASGDDSA